MKTYILLTIVGAASLGLAACDQRSDTSGTGTTPNGTSTNGSGTDGTTTRGADNTARNRRDTDADTQTPIDQNENATDIRITADIRRAIMDDKAMSTNAQNCKIITANGVVTLRGPVDSQAERDAIEAKAKAVAGVTSVDNQLEIKTP